MLAKCISWIRSKPFVVILIIILAIITIVSIKPGYYLMGWDNYSSFFNKGTNIWRWFFHTWREFRGLGVPSDSEITELPRQLFFLFLSPIFPEQLQEQLYFLFSLFVGAISTYILFHKLINKYENLKPYSQWGGFIAALFYLFNLNTLSIYYFPITPYITRFFGIPLLFLAFYEAFTTKHLSWKQLIFIIIAVFITAPGYVIGTVFVTTVIALGIFTIFQKNIAKGILVALLFCILNAYWLLPFANYTIHNSKELPLAPIFIQANEAQLNKPASFYALDKQLMLLPNFFETRVSGAAINRSVSLHPLGDRYQYSPTYEFLLIFPLLYLVGSALILFHWKRYPILLSIPIIIGAFLFFSLKEYSPVSFIYKFLSEYVPYFNVIFRFGDTKFHPYIAFGGSLATAFLLTYIISLIHTSERKLVSYVSYIIICILLIAAAIPFRYYFTGDLFGFYMYNKLPPAYKEIADIINSDQEDVRAVHLPYDDFVYWRSYSWGYIGSSFLHYLLDKPLFEKTFEPASMENGYVMEQIQRILHNTQSLDDTEITKRAQQLNELLTKLGVKYVILDETVSTDQPTRGILLWGSFNYPEAERLLQKLTQLGSATIAYESELHLIDYMDYYEKRLTMTEEVRQGIVQADPQKIRLYKLQSPAPKAQFLSQATDINSQLKEQILNEAYIHQQHTINKPQAKTFYPFLMKNNQLEHTSTGLQMKFKTDYKNETAYLAYTSENQNKHTFLFELTGYIKGKNVVITPYVHYFPTINGTPFRSPLNQLIIPIELIESSLNTRINTKNFAASWNKLPHETMTDLRLSVNDTIMPIPPLTKTEKSIGYTILDVSTIEISVLIPYKNINVDINNVLSTEPINCFSDELEDYTSNITHSSKGITVNTRNGSACFWYNLDQMYNKATSHIELEMSMQGSTKNLDEKYGPTFQQNTKPYLIRTIKDMEKPNTLQICIKEQNVDNCYNTYQFFNIPHKKTSLRIPTTKNIDYINNPLIFFALKNTQYQEQKLQIDSLKIQSYRTIGEEIYEFTFPKTYQKEMNINNDTMTIDLPYTNSTQSYFYNSAQNMFIISNDSCKNMNGYRTYRFDKGTFLSYAENCQNQIFTELPFSSERFYLWNTQYYLGSGRFPKYIINDGFFNYKEEYLSVYNGYPNIEGFKKFQDPEQIFNSYQNISFPDMPFHNTYTYVYPYPEFQDSKPKQYALQQYAENEGFILINNYNIFELPNYWPSFIITPKKQTNTTYALAQINNFISILPSLKKIDIDISNIDNNEKEILLKFNEGYDEQWGLYQSFSSMIFGDEIPHAHHKCDGYANCFIISVNDIAPYSSIYIFYWPEILHFVGLTITIMTIMGIIIIVFLYNKNAQKHHHHIKAHKKSKKNHNNNHPHTEDIDTPSPLS